MLEVVPGQLSKEHIDALVAARRTEQRDLEYKEVLPGNADRDRHEFLADISSFANAAGGYLLYGIRAERDANGKTTGAPEQVVGLNHLNSDQVAVQRDSMIRDGIAPRIPGVVFKQIDGFDSGPVLAVHIPRSFAGPHMVTYKNRSRFYARGAAGRYQLDVHQIRESFGDSETTVAALDDFRRERLARILAGQTPVELPPGPKLVVHVVPRSALHRGAAIDMDSVIQDSQQGNVLRPLHSRGWSNKRNFDGNVSFDPPSAPSGRSYTQLFRAGAVELVSTRALTRGEREIPGIAIEREVIERVAAILPVLYRASIASPISVMLSLLGVRSFRMAFRQSAFYDDDASEIDRDDLIIPESEISADSHSVGEQLRPAFDLLWQACGWPGSPSYDAEGKWQLTQGM